MANPVTFTVGRDGSAVIIWNGSTITLPNLTRIKTTPKFTTIKSKPVNTGPQTRMLPDGHEIEVSFDRTDPSIELLASQSEAGYWNSGTAAGTTTNNGSLFLYINESNGAQTIKNYQQVAWALTDSGTYDADNPVKMEIKGEASIMTVM